MLTTQNSKDTPPFAAVPVSSVALPLASVEAVTPFCVMVPEKSPVTTAPPARANAAPAIRPMPAPAPMTAA